MVVIAGEEEFRTTQFTVYRWLRFPIDRTAVLSYVSSSPRRHAQAWLDRRFALEYRPATL